MSRPLKEKYASTRLHQAWFILIASTLLTFMGKLDGTAFVMACGLAMGIYAYSNVQKAKLYSGTEEEVRP